jgi:hypothetical protein
MARKPGFEGALHSEVFGDNGAKGETMRILFAAATLFAGLCLLAPGQASQRASGGPCRKQGARRGVAGVRSKQIGKQTYARRKTVKLKRRYDWTYYPYWRPYQYHYWQYIYPDGGPLF